MPNIVEVRDLRVEARTDAGRTVRDRQGRQLRRRRRRDRRPDRRERARARPPSRSTLMGYTRARLPHRRRLGPGRRHGHGRACPSPSAPSCAAPRSPTSPQSAAAAFNPAQAHHRPGRSRSPAIHGLMPRRARPAGQAPSRSSAPSPCPIPRRSASAIRTRSPAASCSGCSAAMALIGDPKLVIFDEPTTALDVTTQIEVLRAFKSVMRDGRHRRRLCLARPRRRRADRRPHRRAPRRRDAGERRRPRPSSTPRRTPTRASCSRPSARRRTPRPLGAEPRRASRCSRSQDVVAGYGPAGRDGLPAMVAVRRHRAARSSAAATSGVIGESGCGKIDARARDRGPAARLVPAASGSTAKMLPPTSRGRSKDQLRRMQIVFQIADTALNPAHAGRRHPRPAAHLLPRH